MKIKGKRIMAIILSVSWALVGCWSVPAKRIVIDPLVLSENNAKRRTEK